MSCIVSSQKLIGLVQVLGPSSGLDKAKVQGQRRSTFVSSLEQKDVVWVKNLLEQRIERVELELSLKKVCCFPGA